MNLLYVLIISYLLIGLVLLFINPLNKIFGDGYNSFALSYIMSKNYIDKLLGGLGLMIIIIIAIVVLCTYPLLFLLRILYSKNITETKSNITVEDDSWEVPPF